ncbi:hypothetical protein [Synergistes jonesii]|nr:hypothetical protein [Synergistes jonesii]
MSKRALCFGAAFLLTDAVVSGYNFRQRNVKKLTFHGPKKILALEDGKP